MITKPLFLELITEVEFAGLLAYEYFSTNESVNEQKADGSVVTAIDKAIEARLVSYIYPFTFSQRYDSWRRRGGVCWHQRFFLAYRPN